MTQKDYIKLAEAFKDARSYLRSASVIEGAPIDHNRAFQVILIKVEGVLKADNPKFSFERFREAINGKESAKDADE